MVAPLGCAPDDGGGATNAGPPVVAVSVFDNETGDPSFDQLVSSLSDTVVVRLTEMAPSQLAVIGNAEVLRRPRNIRNLQALVGVIRADYVVLGQLQRTDTGLRFISHLIRLPEETHLRARTLPFQSSDPSTLEAAVVTELEQAVRQHVLVR
jgi:TolB-like protein